MRLHQNICFYVQHLYAATGCNIYIDYLPCFFPDDPSESIPVVPLPLADHLLPLPTDLPRRVAPTPAAAVVQAQALRSRLCFV